MTNQPASPSFVVVIPTGVVIRCPETGRRINSGESVPRDTFWRRLLESGEVKERSEPKPAAAPAATKKA